MSIAIIGGRSDGQAGVVIDIINNIFNQKVEYIFDTTPELKGKIIKGAKVVGSFRNCAKRYLKDISGIHIAIGDNQSRLDYYKLSTELCLNTINIIHPSAIISNTAMLGNGVFVGAGSIIQNDVVIGDASIINTGSIIEHDCIISDGVHIAPGVSLAGRVKVNKNAFIGIGSTIIPDILVGENAFVAAGSTVVKNIKDSETVMGIPARSKGNIYKDHQNAK